MKIEIDLCAFDTALSELIALERFSSSKAGVKKGKVVDDVDMLTVSCMASAVFQDLVGYLSDEESDKLNTYRKSIIKSVN